MGGGGGVLLLPSMRSIRFSVLGGPGSVLSGRLVIVDKVGAAVMWVDVICHSELREWAEEILKLGGVGWRLCLELTVGSSADVDGGCADEFASRRKCCGCTSTMR